MNPDAAQFAEVATVIVAMVGALAFISVTTFFLIRRITQSPRPRLDDQRLEQLQQSVDAIAIEVERITEAQRYTAKLLAERTHEAPDSPIGARFGESRSPLKG